MARDIAVMFYEHGGYESDSASSDKTNYIDYDDVTSTYVPQALLRLNAICGLSRTVSFDTGSVSSGNSMDDVILAELALSIADSEYDKLHIDPDTGAMENKHYTVAKQYMLDMYGVSNKGEIVLPNQIEGNKAYFDMRISTLSV
jgi:hypothetical protein